MYHHVYHSSPNPLILRPLRRHPDMHCISRPYILPKPPHMPHISPPYSINTNHRPPLFPPSSPNSHLSPPYAVNNAAIQSPPSPAHTPSTPAIPIPLLTCG